MSLNVKIQLTKKQLYSMIERLTIDKVRIFVNNVTWALRPTKTNVQTTGYTGVDGGGVLRSFFAGLFFH